jgi:hypothetical protein
MPQIDQDHVKLCGGIVVWDGVTQPEIAQAGAKAGQPKWSLKVVFPPTCPDLPLFDALARKKLQESKFRGQLPSGGRMPIGMVLPGEFNDMFPGWCVISFKTTLKAPDVYGIDPTGSGVLQDPMMYTRMVYAGQTVDVLAHCYDYDAAGNKGISAGIDAFSYPLNSQAPRLPFAGSGMNTGAAFGAPQQPAAPYGAPQQPAAPYGAPQQPAAPYGAPQQAHGYLPPQ